MNKNEGKMKVYMVAGGVDCEGENLEWSGKVFLKREDAVKYGESLVDGSYRNEEYVCRSRWDYYEIKEVEVL